MKSPLHKYVDQVEAITLKEQLQLFGKKRRQVGNGEKAVFSDPAFATNKRQPIHRWVPWIAGFASEFVQDALDRYLHEPGVVLDPFAGVGTTLIEALRKGHDAVGFEINPYAALASEVKTAASRIDPASLRTEIANLEAFFREAIRTNYQPRHSSPEGFRSRTEFYSPSVLHKVLVLWDHIESIDDQKLARVFRLAFGATMVQYSNYSYEPSLGTRRGAGRADIEDYDVLGTVLGKLAEILEDVSALRRNGGFGQASARVIQDSFFSCEDHLEAMVADIIITSPPYLNNYHYVRNTRPHLYWLGFAAESKDTKPIEHANFGKYWQTVRSEDRRNLDFELPNSDLPDVLEHLRSLNPDRGVYGGNGWANYAASYFNDCYRFAEGMQYALKPGAVALVVIGNSILQGVHVATDRYLGEIAQTVGLELVEIHTPRETRVGNSIIQSNVRVGKAKMGRQLYEAVVELRKPKSV